MLNDLRFSLPLWPGLSPDEFQNVVWPILEECAPVIEDLYFTCRIPPFTSDAMGGIIHVQEVATVQMNAIEVGRAFNIPVSATFNNIHVDPRRPNYEIFCTNFEPLYEQGVRIVTVPHTSWLLWGLKERFPGLVVKNTVLHKVNTAAEVARLFEAGFDTICVDRNLIRDFETLAEISKARSAMMKVLGRPLKISLLYNEMCEGYCPVQSEHYAYNCGRCAEDPPWFGWQDFSNVSSCKIRDESSAAYILKAAAIPSYYSTLDRLSDMIQLFKMHGRESKAMFYGSLSLIRSFVRRDLIVDPFRTVLSRLSAEERRAFLTRTETCKFNCWSCSLCEALASKADA